MENSLDNFEWVTVMGFLSFIKLLINIEYKYIKHLLDKQIMIKKAPLSRGF